MNYQRNTTVPVENRYAPPQTRVQDIAPEQEEFGELRLWSIKGRIGRLRFMARMVANMLLVIPISNILFAIVMPSLQVREDYVVLSLLGIFLLPVLYFAFCTTAQRLHDMGYSAWFTLLNFILPIIPLIFLVLMCAPGKKDCNKYGPLAPPNSVLVRIFGALAMIFTCGLMANVLIALLTGAASG